MLVKLALGNVRKSARDYLIYFITIAFSVALLYAFNTIDSHVDMLSHRRLMIRTIDSLMNVLSYVLIVALALLIIYANNYLIRRRSKEFALYQIFGMRRRDVATILTIETFLSSLSALIIGLVLGVLLSQFLVFVTGRIVQETVTNYHFVFLPKAIAFTVIAFGIIFLLTLLLNLLTLRRFQLVDLVKHARSNEASRLQSKWVTIGLFIGALALIGLAYWRLMHIGYPFETISSYTDSAETTQEWMKFGLTTAIVCVGTYMLFYSFGGVLLYFARTSRRVYWRGLNMFTVREFASKIKSAALSMGSISIILFLMLSVITPAFGVSASAKKAIDKNAPYAATFELSYSMFLDGQDGTTTRSLPFDSTNLVSLDEVRLLLDEKGIFSESTATDQGDYSGIFMGEPAHMVLTPTVGVSYMADDEGNPVNEKHSVPCLAEYVNASGYDTSQWGSISKEITGYDFSSFEVMPISAYNARRAFAGLEPMTVGEGEYAVAYFFRFSGLRDMYVSALNSGLEIELAGQTVKPAGGASAALDDSPAAIFSENFFGENSGMLIVSDSLFLEIEKQENSYAQVYAAVTFDGNSQTLHSQPDTMSYFYEPFEDDNAESVDTWYMGTVSTRADSMEYAIESLGIATYVSIYVGFVLAMISAAMLAVQILSGVSEAAPRYRRLSQIGASRREENRSLAVQIAWYFALPLLVAACHAWVAVGEALTFIEFIMPVSIVDGVLVTAALVVGVYAIYGLVSYWSAKSVIAPDANLTER